MNEAVPLVMCDYLDFPELRSCGRVCRLWRSFASNALMLPRLVREKAARRVQKAWRNCPRKVRSDLTRALIPEGYEEVLRNSSWEAFGGSWAEDVIGSEARVEFFGSGASLREEAEGGGWIRLSRTAGLITDFWADKANSVVPLRCGGVRMENVLDFPGAVVPNGMLSNPVFARVPRGTTLRWTAYYLPGFPKRQEGPINGVPGLALKEGTLVHTNRERKGTSRTRILGIFA